MAELKVKVEKTNNGHKVEIEGRPFWNTASVMKHGDDWEVWVRVEVEGTLTTIKIPSECETERDAIGAAVAYLLPDDVLEG